MKRYLPWIVLALAALYLGRSMAPARYDAKTEMDLAAFGKIPVIDGGRVKPIDTYARVRLMLVSRLQTYYDGKGDRQPATKWLLNIWAEGLKNYESQVVIQDRDVQEWFGLPADPRGRFDIDEVVQAARAKAAQLQKLAEKNPDAFDPLERKVMMVGMAVVNRHKAVQKMTEVQKAHGSPLEAKVFRIDFDQLLAMFQLEPRLGFRYSLLEFTGQKKSEAVQQLLRRADAAAARQRAGETLDIVDARSLELANHLRDYAEMTQLGGVLAVAGPANDKEDWLTVGQAIATDAGANNPAAKAMEDIVRHYAMGDVEKFNAAVAGHLTAMKARFPADVSGGRLETWFNQFAPFYQCANLYVLMMLLAMLSWVVWRDTLGRAAFWLGVLIAVVHTFALLLRMYLTGRPPVTNLYSSAVFIGWGCVLLCLGIDFRVRNNPYRYNFGTFVASALGFSTMVIAHHLGGSGDTMEMMQAVLDTNLWLATHVTTVTLGYAATFAAGFLAMVFVFRMVAGTVRHFFALRRPLEGREGLHFVVAVAGLVALPAMFAMGVLIGLWVLWAYGESMDLGIGLTFAMPVVVVAAIFGAWLVHRRSTPEGLPDGIRDSLTNLSLTAEGSRVLSGMIYGVVCFATLLSFVGTVLGGIWADQSWGRFWGWDPKENGALLIVIMNALILHARWGGMIKERGLATLALVGNMVVAWSWFGTNQLGVGLHAYGFNKSLAMGCALFWVSQGLLLSVGLLPLRYWRLYAEQTVPSPASPPAGGRGQRGSSGIQPA